VHALVFMLATGTFVTNWYVVALAVVLGAVMTASLGMVAGAAGKGFATTLLYCSVFMILLFPPVPSLLHHSESSLFVKAIPSYGLAKALMGATVGGQGWAELAPHLGTVAAWDVILLVVGSVVLKRRVEPR
jgi:hypothetical protein